MMPAEAKPGEATPTSLRAHAVHVAERATRDAVERRLLGLGVSRGHLEDETQNVLRELFEVRVPPATLEACIALARHIARQRAIDYVRKRARRAKDDVGLTDTADDHASGEDGTQSRDPVDRDRQLRLLREQIASGDISRRQLKILTGVADGLDQTEIARGIKVSPKTVRNELSLARKTYRSAWGRIAAPAALLTVMLVVLGQLRQRDRGAVSVGGDHGRVIVGAPPAEKPPREPTAKERAGELRRQAIHDCDVGRFGACLKELDEARGLDPQGEAGPRLEKARRDAQAGAPSEGGDGG